MDPVVGHEDVVVKAVDVGGYWFRGVVYYYRG